MLDAVDQKEENKKEEVWMMINNYRHRLLVLNSQIILKLLWKYNISGMKNIM